VSEIYALIDAQLLKRHGLTPEKVAAFLRRHRIPIMQYRDKNGDPERILRQLERFRKLYDGTIIVNDRPQLAAAVDGVHLGQEDLRRVDPDPSKAVEKIRVIIGKDRWLGLSTHTSEEILAANRLDLDYIGLGAYRPSTTKNVSIVSGNKLLEIASYSRHPVALIGGIKWDETFGNAITYRVIGSALFEKIIEEKTG